MRLEATTPAPELADELRALRPWMHPFDFGNGLLVGSFKYHGIDETALTPSTPEPVAAAMRDAYADYRAGVPEALLERAVAGLGDVSGLSFIDIACATGKHSFELVRLGAGTVRGVEIRPEQVEQARLIQRVDARFASAKLSFEHVPVSADDPEFLAGQGADVVLSFGLLYHVTNPLQHLLNVRRLARRAAIVSTFTHTLAPDMWVFSEENPEGITKATAGVSWTPYFADVARLLRRVGFERVEPVYHPALANLQRAAVAIDAATFGRRFGRLARRPALLAVAAETRRRLPELLRHYQNPAYFTFVATT